MVEGGSAMVTVAALGVALAPWGPPLTPAAAALAAGASPAASGLLAPTGGGRAAGLTLIEAMAMVVVNFLLARRAPPRQAVAVLPLTAAEPAST